MSILGSIKQESPLSSFIHNLTLDDCPGSGVKFSSETESVLCYCGKVINKTRQVGDWTVPKHKERLINV